MFRVWVFLGVNVLLRLGFRNRIWGLNPKRIGFRNTIQE